MNCRRGEETQAVKKALVAAGYAGVRVSHGAGTAYGWLHIKCEAKPGQDYAGKLRDVEAIAQRVTGRHGDYGGNINIS